jgi:hypothetical protein
VNAIVKQARQSITVVGRVVSAAQRRVADGTGNTFSDDTLQFLEPIDQITEASPPRFMRSTLYVILAMVLTGLVISSIVKIDLVVVGRGTLTTEHAPMVLQPFDRSIIRDVQVRPGDTVHKGQVLATLDSTFAQADLSTLTSQQRGGAGRPALRSRHQGDGGRTAAGDTLSREYEPVQIAHQRAGPGHQRIGRQYPHHRGGPCLAG